ncbi:unnamed protein product [Darwinula stevensoni]|uniref:Protein XRP2 n=1 Tax=Darwinula stevensoni TaxID=69355 RepID=A0A7R8X5R8_9CRUS|nr:unnamed protein product [Darwinula stevensoni]CAG0881209.1 unnamed protein product [Darwinula stevensoni]
MGIIHSCLLRLRGRRRRDTFSGVATQEEAKPDRKPSTGSLKFMNEGSRKRRKSSKRDPEHSATSWDTGEKVDPKDYTIENQRDVLTGRTPGTIRGQQFIIQNCSNSSIYLYDHIGAITVDDCSDCKMFIGPVRSSQPIIESSSNINFAPFQYFYPQLEADTHFITIPDQINNAGLSPFNCNWSNIHDFTPSPTEPNWSILPEATNLEEYLPPPTPDQELFKDMSVSLEPSKSVVPATAGIHCVVKSQESALVAFFSDGQHHDRARSFIRDMKEANPQSQLIQAQELYLTKEDAQRVFQSPNYADIITMGSVVGLEYNGPGTFVAAQKVCPLYCY